MKRSKLIARRSQLQRQQALTKKFNDWLASKAFVIEQPDSSR